MGNEMAQLEDFNRIEIAMEAGLLIVRLIARNKFGEEWTISESSVPLRSLSDLSGYKTGD